MLTFLAVCLSHPLPSPSLSGEPPPLTFERSSCAGEALSPCTSGRTGPACDLECLPGQRCDYALYCHSWGATYGLSVFGGFLFPAPPDGSGSQVAAELSRFIITHPDSLGLAPGIAAGDLGLTPHPSFRGEAGALRLLRFDQTYRGLPVFGPDAVVKLVATSTGALSLRGAVLDGRVKFKHVDEPSTAASAATSIRFHVAQQTGLATTAGAIDDAGCNCRSAPSASWLTALLGGALIRRRRRAALGLAALCSLPASQVACGPVPVNESDTSTSGSSTGTTTSTGGTPDRPSSRMFGKFHQNDDQVGYTNEDETEGWYLYFWGTLQVNPNGTLTVTNHSCTAEWPRQEFTWVLDEDKTLRVIPDTYFSDGTFKFFGDHVMAVSLAAGQSCDDIEMLIEYLPQSGRMASRSLWLPGELCAEGPGEDCVFTFVWCDGAAPPACTE